MRKRNVNNEDNTSDGRVSTSSTSNRPKENALTQQRLPALKPTFEPKTVLLLLFGIGIVFIPIGIIVLVTSTHIQEKVIDYTDCRNTKNPSSMCKDEIILQPNVTERDCNCTENFTLDENWEGDVYMYYGLENFYQNHRRYIVSRSDE